MTDPLSTRLSDLALRSAALVPRLTEAMLVAQALHEYESALAEAGKGTEAGRAHNAADDAQALEGYLRRQAQTIRDALASATKGPK